MPPVQLAFGGDERETGTETYFVSTPKKWGWDALPDFLCDSGGLFPPGDHAKVAEVHCISFGLNGLFGNDYFISYRSPDGADRYQHSLTNYPILHDWLAARNEEVFHDIEVSLGSAPGQFFARHRDTYRWSGVHKRLNENLINHVRNPKTEMHVVLGMSDTYIHWRDSSKRAGWSDLDKKGRIVYASLNQYQRDQYLIMFEKEIHWNLPEAWSLRVDEYINFYMKELDEAEKARLAEISRCKNPDKSRGKPSARSSKASKSRTLVQGAGVIPLGRKKELLNIISNTVGPIAGVMQVSLAAAALCTIL